MEYKYNAYLEKAHDVSAHWMIIKPKQTSYLHAHLESEIFIIVSGTGICLNHSGQCFISLGDVFYFKNLESHQFINTSDRDDLILLSLVWAQMPRIMHSKNLTMQKDQSIIITSTPPTPNGDLHLGHLSGPYLRADVLKRFLKLMGKSAIHCTGSDDYQSYTQYKAQTINQTAEQTAHYFTHKIKNTFQEFFIDVDRFECPSEYPEYTEKIQTLFSILLSKGVIVSKESPTLYCRHCYRYVYEVYVSGACPFCSAKTCGALCEHCGFINDGADLKNPMCCCGHTPDLTTFVRYYFELEPFRERLIHYYHSVQLNTVLKKYCFAAVRRPLPSVPVSYIADWGIKLPVDEKQIISAWLEMGLRHYLLLENIHDPYLIQFFGFDNSFFNALLFPSIFMALNKEDFLAKKLVMNPFYCLDKKKFSTSRAHLIYASEFLSNHCVDYARLYLAYSGSDYTQGNFDFTEYQHCIQTIFLGKWLHLCVAIENDFIQFFNKKMPDIGLWQENHNAFYMYLTRSLDNIKTYYESNEFSLRAILEQLNHLVLEADQFLQQNRLLFSEPSCADENRTTICLLYLMLKSFSIAIYPILPYFSGQLASIMQLSLPLSWNEALIWIKPNTSIIGMNNLYLSYRGLNTESIIMQPLKTEISENTNSCA